jgi:hypothetical protein
MTNTKVDVKAVEEAISRRLYAFNASRHLAWAWNAGENIILTGDGGYGKSDAAVIFNDYLFEEGIVKDEKPFVLSFGSGMTEDRLLGGLDVKKFQEDGEIRFLLEHAFVSSEVVIFEELFDAPLFVLLILKDILQSKSVRMGAKIVPIKTKIVIACTNRSREEVVEDASTAALMERFVFEVEVGWKTHRSSDYRMALNVATNYQFEHSFELNTVADLCAKVSQGDQGYKVSPRTAGKLFKAVTVNGLDCVQGFYGFEDAWKELNEGLTEMRTVESQRTKLTELFGRLSQMISVHERRSALGKCVLAKKICLMRLNIQEESWHDAVIEKKDTLVETLVETETLALRQAKDLLKFNGENLQDVKGWRKLLVGGTKHQLYNLIRIHD